MDDPMDIDSDFYGAKPPPTQPASDQTNILPGNEETITSLNARVSSFNPPKGPRAHGLPSHLIRPCTTPSTNPLHNPYADLSCAWQLSETVDSFLNRLPPSTTPVTASCPWIYIANPFIPPPAPSPAQSQPLPRACEPEAPMSSDSLDRFIEGGMARLHLLSDFITHARASGKPPTVIGREINRERAVAVQQILDLAHHLDVRAGKWMLFPEPGYVDDIWGVVARYTANNELGTAAKVAPKGEANAERTRLICVYTRDFRDEGDVARVLGRMKELGLVREKGRMIYYKCGECVLGFEVVVIGETANPQQMRSLTWASEMEILGGSRRLW